MPEPSFLVVRLGSLGDIVHAFPAVSGLRESFPKQPIVWLTHPKWKSLVETSSLASEIWTIESRDMASVKAACRRIRSFAFQTAIDYQGLWKSAALPFLARIPRRVGFASETIREFGVPILYTDRIRITSAHVVDQNAELSRRAGAQNGVAPVELTVDAGSRAKIGALLAQNGIGEYVVLSPGGGWRSKCWPAQRFGELARRIREQLKLRCVLNFGPGEEDLVRALIEAAGSTSPLPVTGSLGELMALLSGTRCVVAGDTGPLHLADALRTPVVAIFGPTDPARNGPYFRTGEVLRAPNVETTYKRRDEPHPSLLQLSVDEVFAAVQRVTGVHA